MYFLVFLLRSAVVDLPNDLGLSVGSRGRSHTLNINNSCCYVFKSPWSKQCGWLWVIKIHKTQPSALVNSTASFFCCCCSFHFLQPSSEINGLETSLPACDSPCQSYANSSDILWVSLCFQQHFSFVLKLSFTQFKRTKAHLPVMYL